MVDIEKFRVILEENNIISPWIDRHLTSPSLEKQSNNSNVFGFLMYLYVVESSDVGNNKIRHIKLLRDMTRSTESVMSLRQSKQVYESLLPHFINEDKLTDIGFILREDIKSCFNQDLSVLVAKTLLLGGGAYNMKGLNDFL